MIKTVRRLCDLKLSGQKVCECEYVDVSKECRLYFSPDKKEGCGFDFYAVQWCAGDPIESGSEEVYADCLIHGFALFDGIRHLYFGDQETDNFGYLYYQDVELLREALACLLRLEGKYCSDKREGREDE